MLRHRAPSFSASAHRQAQLAERARSMRVQMTASESALWRAIRAGQLGVAFRRQYVIGEFIADFAAPAVRVIGEVDGSWHHGRGAADERRDRRLARLGWRVVRVTAEMGIRDVPPVAEAIRAAIARVTRLAENSCRDSQFVEVANAK